MNQKRYNIFFLLCIFSILALFKAMRQGKWKFYSVFSLFLTSKPENCCKNEKKRLFYVGDWKKKSAVTLKPACIATVNRLNSSNCMHGHVVNILWNEYKKKDTRKMVEMKKKKQKSIAYNKDSMELLLILEERNRTFIFWINDSMCKRTT